MKTPFFSIIVACYNEERIIARCLNSLIGQDFKDFEIIMVNDGSNDNTKKILDEYANNKKIKIIHKETNEDKPKRINEGLAVSKGKIIAITDADSIVPKNWLSSIKKEFDSDKRLDAVGGVYDSAGNDVISLAGNMFERIFMDTKLIPNVLPGANAAYRRTSFVDAGGYPLRKWGADSMIDLNMREKKNKIKISSNIVVKNGYPKTIRAALKRKFFWGGGLVSILDKTKFRLGFLIRPAYFLFLILSLMLTIVFGFIDSTLFMLSTTLFLGIIIAPTTLFLSLSLAWIIKKRKYAHIKALPLMLFLPLLQEFSYFVGFMYVIMGGRLENAWRQKRMGAKK